MSELQRPTEQKEKDLRTLADRLGGRKDFGSRMSAEDAKLIERVMGSKLGGKFNNDGRIDPEERQAILALQSKDKHYSKSLTKGGISASFLYSQLRDELVEDYKANNSVGNKSAEFTRALENYNARLKELTSWKEREFSGDNVFKGFSLEDPTLTGAPKSLAEIKERSAALERRAQELSSITGEAKKFFEEEIAKRQGVADSQITKRSETDSAAVVAASPAGELRADDPKPEIKEFEISLPAASGTVTLRSTDKNLVDRVQASAGIFLADPDAKLEISDDLKSFKVKRNAAIMERTVIVDKPENLLQKLAEVLEEENKQ
jgi:hypothetical protein